MTAIDRRSLLETLDRFVCLASGDGDLSAIVLPRARVTENGRIVALDDLLWRSTALTPYRLEFADEEAGQAGCHATFLEADQGGIFGLRIKVEIGGLISEIESTIARKGDSNAFAVHRLVSADPLFERVESNCLPRETLIGIADAYFDAVEASDGTNAPIADHCKRIEN